MVDKIFEKGADGKTRYVGKSWKDFFKTDKQSIILLLIVGVLLASYFHSTRECGEVYKNPCKYCLGDDYQDYYCYKQSFLNDFNNSFDLEEGFVWGVVNETKT